MTQLVELQRSLPKFEAAGIKLYAVSYDTVEEIAAFSRAHDIGYTLLSDEGSKVIRSYGILNTFVTEEQVPFHGIPFPGTYIVDESGRVSAKFFRRNLAQRDNAETMIDGALGEILLGDDEPAAAGGSDEIRVSATYHGGDGTIKAGVMRHLVVRFELANGLHIYGEPVPDGMIATKVTIDGPDGIHTEPAQTPPTKPLRLPGLATELHVWEGTVDISIPIWADDRVQSLVDDTGLSEIELAVAIEYQACDDRACRIPQKETLQVVVPVGQYTTHTLAGRLNGERTTMNSQRLMQRKVLRALVRRPIAGLRFLRKTVAAVRRGPAGSARRRRSDDPV